MHILIVDDDKTLSTMLSEYLGTQGFDISQAYDGKSGLALALDGNADVVLLDVMLPQMDGFEVLKALRVTSLVPVIMLTAKGDDFDRIFGLELGADDYIAKPFNHRELLARVKAITRRIENIQEMQQPSHYQCGDIELSVRSRTANVNSKPLALTGTEFSILHVLIASAGTIVSKEAISMEVLGRRLAPFDRSIDMHVSNVRKKIAELSERECIVTVRGAGYVMVDEC